MARQTRAQRRARRAEQTPASTSVEQPALQRARTRQPALRPAQQPAPAERTRRAPGSGAKRFVAESYGELKKVEWPGQSQLIQGVVVVLVACIIVGAFLYSADLVFKRLVQNVFLR